MDRRAFIVLIALGGCAPKTAEPETKTVTLPAGLNRETRRDVTKGLVADKGTAQPKESSPEAVAAPTAAKPKAPPFPSVKMAPKPEAATMTAGARPTPLASETHRLAYRVEGSGAVELEGVCRFSESEIACWDAQGADLPNLKAQIESALNSDNSAYNNLSIRYGRKNRIVVVRQEQMPTVNGVAPKMSMNLFEVGTDPRQGGSSISLPSESPDFNSNKPFVNHQARIIAADSEEKETRMRIMVSEPIPNPVEIELKKGASTSFGGCRFTVVGIEKGARQGGPFMSPEAGELWTVRLSQSGKPARPAMFSVQDYGRFFRDEKGKIVDGAVQREWMTKAQQKGEFDPSKSPFKPVQISGYSTGPSVKEMLVVMNADPKTIKTMRLNGSYQRMVDVTGIPLDPK